MNKEIDKPTVEILVAEGEKCNRCWKILPEVEGENGICRRCESVVNAQTS